MFTAFREKGWSYLMLSCEDMSSASRDTTIAILCSIKNKKTAIIILCSIRDTTINICKFCVNTAIVILCSIRNTKTHTLQFKEFIEMQLQYL